jgi:hypothetical protein
MTSAQSSPWPKATNWTAYRDDRLHRPGRSPFLESGQTHFLKWLCENITEQVILKLYTIVLDHRA